MEDIIIRIPAAWCKFFISKPYSYTMYQIMLPDDNVPESQWKSWVTWEANVRPYRRDTNYNIITIPAEDTNKLVKILDNMSDRDMHYYHKCCREPLWYMQEIADYYQNYFNDHQN